MNSLHVARFTVAYWCVFVAVLLPLVCAWLAKSGGFGKPRREGGYDNHDPRAWLARQTGFRARANAAQANCFEAFPFFAVGVVLALLTGVDPWLVNLLAVLFVAARLAFVACYLADKATFRTIFWTLGYVTVVALIVLAMMNLQIS